MDLHSQRMSFFADTLREYIAPGLMHYTHYSIAFGAHYSLLNITYFELFFKARI